MRGLRQVPDEALARVLARWRAAGGRRPFFIGIGGGSAAGKSTLAAQLARRLQPLRVQVVGQDRFFKKPADMPHYFSPTDGRHHPAYNEPDSFEVEEMLSACRALKEAECEVVVLEGILVLWFEELRQLMDLRLYLEADADERIIRRIRRNMKEREDYEFIANYYLESVRYQHEQYNAPTARYADLIVPGGVAEEAQREAVVGALVAALHQELGAP